MRWRCKRCLRRSCRSRLAIVPSPFAVLCAHDADGSGGPAQHDLPCAALCAAMAHGIAGPVPPEVVAATAVPHAIAALVPVNEWVPPQIALARHPCAARSAARLISDRFEPSVARHAGAQCARTGASISETDNEIHSACRHSRIRRDCGVCPRVQGRFDRDQASLVARHAQGRGGRRRLHEDHQHRHRARPPDRRLDAGRRQVRDPRDVDGQRRDEDAAAAERHRDQAGRRPSSSSPAPII